MYNERVQGGFLERRRLLPMNRKATRRPLYWLLPLLFALPLLAGGAYAAYRYLPQLEPLVEVALKVVVIP